MAIISDSMVEIAGVQAGYASGRDVNTPSITHHSVDACTSTQGEQIRTPWGYDPELEGRKQEPLHGSYSEYSIL